MFAFGIESKNAKTISECLDELSEFIKHFGIALITEKEVKIITKMSEHADKSIKENASKVQAKI